LPVSSAGGGSKEGPGAGGAGAEGAGAADAVPAARAAAAGGCGSPAGAVKGQRLARVRLQRRLERFEGRCDLVATLVLALSCIAVLFRSC
jgi:hypothetical protein